MPLIPRGLPADPNLFDYPRHRFNAPFMGREDRHYEVGDTFPNFAFYTQHNTQQKIRDFVNKPVIFSVLPQFVAEGKKLLERLAAYPSVTFVLRANSKIFSSSWETEFYYSDEILHGTDAVIFVGDENGDILENLVNDDRVFVPYVISAVDQQILGFIPDLSEESLETALAMIADGAIGVAKKAKVTSKSDEAKVSE